MNHGKGFEQAAANTRELCHAWLDRVRIETGDPEAFAKVLEAIAQYPMELGTAAAESRP